ncbi:hypothetical protein [Arenibacter algicola]|uniref:Uncharacterized protein n=1 Tax=Arenibacter algicola TaxID=616991 RepID=A0A221UVR0_9FLAO|nr:hypothetical protein [Arenibacter algicola]ASO05435.1 hypothetical protein AREALGSMS7_01974 [Arenibacter algicola]
MNKIFIPIFLLSSLAFGQSLEEIYIENSKGEWEIYENEKFVNQVTDTTVVYKLKNGKNPQQTLIDNAKESVSKRAEKLSQILTELEINFAELDSLTIIEQRSLNQNLPFDFAKYGAVLTKGEIRGFSYDSAKKSDGIKKIDYFATSKNETLSQAKQIIGNLILSGKTNYLDTIAKVETEMFAGPLKDLRPKTEFEILIINKHNEQQLRRIYLHETFVQIMNQ